MLTGTLQLMILSINSISPGMITVVLMAMVITVIRQLLHSMYAQPDYIDDHYYSEYSYIVDDISDLQNPELVQAVEVSPTPKDYDVLKPFFSWDQADTINSTLSVSTQYARGSVSDNLLQQPK
jgi:hypothetical protein